MADIDGKATTYNARTTARLFDVHMNSNNNYASELSSAKGGGVEVGGRGFIDLTIRDVRRVLKLSLAPLPLASHQRSDVSRTRKKKESCAHSLPAATTC